jgi:ADP-heptose:LPS heptosyltransferase
MFLDGSAGGVRRVAVVRPGRIGDLLCATPALRALRAALPGAEITLVGLPLAADLAARIPDVDRFEPFPGWPGIAEQLFEARRALAFLARMQERRYDLAIQLYGSGVNANPLTLLLGARRTAGFVRPGDAPGRLDASLPLPETGHEVDRVLALPLHLGAPLRGRETRLELRERDRAEADRLLVGLPTPLVGLHAGAREPARRWPAARWVRAAAGVRRLLGGTVVVLGGEDERPEAAGLRARLGAGAVDLAGRTTLPVLAAVVARLDLLLTTDSGPAHVAYALGTPSVTLFRGREQVERYGPVRPDRHAVVIDDEEAVVPAAASVRSAAAARPGSAPGPPASRPA